MGLAGQEQPVEDITPASRKSPLVVQSEASRCEGEEKLHICQMRSINLLHPERIKIWKEKVQTAPKFFFHLFINSN